MLTSTSCQEGTIWILFVTVCPNFIQDTWNRKLVPPSAARSRKRETLDNKARALIKANLSGPNGLQPSLWPRGALSPETLRTRHSRDGDAEVLWGRKEGEEDQEWEDQRDSTRQMFWRYSRRGQTETVWTRPVEGEWRWWMVKRELRSNRSRERPETGHMDVVTEDMKVAGVKVEDADGVCWLTEVIKQKYECSAVSYIPYVDIVLKSTTNNHKPF